MSARPVVAAVILFAAAVSASAGERPRVCLVLSGGGALGVAHIGVLRQLEALHVPVDCVAGTSMGAIVGGLYASGYSPDELDAIVHTLDWSSLIRDAPDRRHLPYRRKVDDVTYLTRWELGIRRNGLVTPAGIVAGHRIGLALRLLALRAGGPQPFDQLAIPFRAVATDARTGETVVLGSGDLGAALRASMAIPGLFSPVEQDGRLLVDGGVVENLPVSAARALGADVIVAVDLEQLLSTRERPSSIGTVLSKTLGVLSRREAERSLAGADVVLRPAVSNFGLLEFSAATMLIALGEQAVFEHESELRRLSLDGDEWQRHIAEQRRTTPVLRLASVSVDPGLGLEPPVVDRLVHTKPGTLDSTVLAADLDRLWELGDFESVDFSLRPAGAGEWHLQIGGRRKQWGPNYLRFGVALVSDLEGSSGFNLLSALTMTRLNALGGEFKITVQAGEQSGFAAEMYQPLTRSGVPFAAVGLQVVPHKVLTRSGLQLAQERLMDRGGAFDLGLALGRYGEIRAGVRRGRFNDRETGILQSTLIVDQLDRVNFPRRGLLVVAGAYAHSPTLGGDDDYRFVELQTVSAATRGRHTLITLIHGRSAAGGSLPERDRYSLGGLFNLSGLAPGEAGGSYGGVGTLLYTYRLGGIPNFADGMYAGVSIEGGNVWPRANDVDLANLRKSAAVIFAVDTVAGPVYVAYGRSTGSRDSLYLYVGRTF